MTSGVPQLDDAAALSIQDRLFPDLTCFGCGPANPKGLRLKSFPGDGTVVARFTPWPEHDNGFGFLNGGIIGTVLDCHSAAAVVLEAEVRSWPALPGANLPYVTAGLDIRYLRPTPLTETLDLRAVIVEAGYDVMTCEVDISWDGKPRAAALATWKRWRPR